MESLSEEKTLELDKARRSYYLRPGYFQKQAIIIGIATIIIILLKIT